MSFDAVVIVSVIYLIAGLAFLLSYSKLTDLASRANYGPFMAHAWPLIVDGLAVIATVAVMRMRRRGYAWCLLSAGTLVSIVAAVASAMLPPGPLPPLAVAAVSVVPPLCLLVAPHLAVKLQRELAAEAAQGATSHDDLVPAKREEAHRESGDAKRAVAHTSQTDRAPSTSQPTKDSHRPAAKTAPSSDQMSSTAQGDREALTPVAPLRRTSAQCAVRRARPTCALRNLRTSQPRRLSANPRRVAAQPMTPTAKCNCTSSAAKTMRSRAPPSRTRPARSTIPSRSQKPSLSSQPGSRSAKLDAGSERQGTPYARGLRRPRRDSVHPKLATNSIDEGGRHEQSTASRHRRACRQGV
ncbi:DUF2637 domain-containing protein [Rhodococcus marinonascens]|uniref:DUF2637 domain-containing protein n=1 Tax=Rhodococcus marinonascens TaxID=38311 RepID=UPI000A056AB3|nr:DUF2637 domain-containing protein [Rhodococcus marinonascens]